MVEGLTSADLGWLITQAGGIWDTLSPASGGRSTGRYVLEMTCEDYAQIVPSDEDKVGFQVNPGTGAAFVQPTVPGNFTFNLTAADAGPGGSDAVSTIREWSVVVIPRPEFQLCHTTEFVYTPKLSETHRLALNWTYSLHPPLNSADPSTLFVNVTGPVTYSVTVANSSTFLLKDDLLVSPTTGLLVVVPSRRGNYTVHVVASDGSTFINLTATPWTFEVLDPDGAWNDIHGPNGRGCGLGARVESANRSGGYTCDCTSTNALGVNCETPRPDSGPGDQTRTTMGLVGGFVALALVATAVLWWQRYRRARTPVDFAAELERLLGEAGVGPQFDVSPGELGLALTLEGLPVDPNTLRAVLTPAVKNGLRNSLKRATSTARGRILARHRVEWDDALIRQSTTNPTDVAVVVKRPMVGQPHEHDDSAADRVLDRVLRAVQAGLLTLHLATGETVRVTAASLMIPRRVPREVPRQSVLRLGRLGSGVAATVMKAQITSRVGHGPPLVVASKEPNDVGEQARAESEREAALLALLGK